MMYLSLQPPPRMWLYGDHHNTQRISHSFARLPVKHQVNSAACQRSYLNGKIEGMNLKVMQASMVQIWKQMLPLQCKNLFRLLLMLKPLPQLRILSIKTAGLLLMLWISVIWSERQLFLQICLWPINLSKQLKRPMSEYVIVLMRMFIYSARLGVYLWFDAEDVPCSSVVACPYH